ncbi:uncharacterized protein PFL1_01357 [Pseudozyma flocculosa PF-1]|uniref:uncharacterized protein n=1 Tax=Pseudozyma flocculosa PF-1 TaxID=1277687 RepID=UPI00045609CD|nr:uncharacterized protein PFL1_01357 [Pseudozyma flocculosa PF-1]EPQ31169.1 hypothetical protein PFL1_01357 [Pseudozyma flocculosa PF-1]
MPPKKVSLPPNPPPDPSQSLPLAYSTFFPVAPLNAKNVSSSYLKTEAQTWISRSQAARDSQQNSASRGKKRKRQAAAAAAATAQGADGDDPDLTAAGIDDDEGDSEEEDAEGEPGKPSGPAARTIVIHPGSEFIRVGRATDLYPLTFPSAIARRPKLPQKQQVQASQPSAEAEPATAAPTDGANGDVGDAAAAAAPAANGSETSSEQQQPDEGDKQDSDSKAPKADDGDKDVDMNANDDGDGDGIETPEPTEAPVEAAAAAKGTRKGRKKDALDQGIDGIRNELRSIMRQEKLRPVGNGKALAANYNDGVSPEDVPEHNDFFGLDWTDDDAGGENTVLVGEKALRLASFSMPMTEKPKQTRRQAAGGSTATAEPKPDPQRPWKLFRPFQRGTLDLNAYEEHYGPSAAVQALLGDVRAILEHAIASPPEDPDSRQESGEVVAHGLGIPHDEWEEHTVILILPDLFSRSDLKALVELLLQDMGFAGACVQTEGVCATFGAGLSTACVVDLGAEQISVSCVEEGLVLPDTRMALSYGGKDISQFLGELFVRAKFPYREIDWQENVADALLLDTLKERLVTLNPADVGLNIHDFYLRLPGRPTVKYLFRTYDELILGPMSLFDPDVFALDRKEMLKGKFRAGYTDELPMDETVVEDAPELGVGYSADLPVTTAMQSCVKHLLPAPPPPPPPPAAAAAAGTPVPAATANGAAGANSVAGSAAAAGPPSETATPAGSAPPPDVSPALKLEDDKAQAADASRTGSPATNAPGGGAAAADSSTPAGTAQASLDANAAAVPEEEPKPTVDIAYEASKVSLDQAVFNSILSCTSVSASAGEERVKKMANNILCVGGTALIPGLGSALEARLNALFATHYAQTTGDASNAPKVTVIPPPRDMDPRSLAWKGMAVFARLESANEMWIRREDWDLFGFRAVKEKTLFL